MQSLDISGDELREHLERLPQELYDAIADMVLCTLVIPDVHIVDHNFKFPYQLQLNRKSRLRYVADFYKTDFVFDSSSQLKRFFASMSFKQVQLLGKFRYPGCWFLGSWGIKGATSNAHLYLEPHEKDECSDLLDNFYFTHVAPK